MRFGVVPYLRRPLLAATLAALGCGASAVSASDGATGVDVVKQMDVNSENGTDVRHITFIHTSDMHGDFHPHDNSRDGQPSEGGIARVATVVKSIRNSSQNSFYVHTGDTIQGSAQALFTRGQAVVDVMNLMGIDAFVPGNWEHTYGLGRFREMFLGTPGNPPLAPWNVMAVNSYYNGQAGNAAGSGVFADPGQPYTTGAPASTAGDLVVAPYNNKPYRVVTIDGVKVGMFGCTTNRGPQIVGSGVTKGVTFTNCKGAVAAANNSPISWPTGHVNADPADPTNGLKTKPEIPRYVSILRTPAGQQVAGEPEGVLGEGVDMVILLSEAGLAENMYNAENFDGIDIIFSSDMHEETNYPVLVETPNGGQTLVVENGEDGAQVGELAIKFMKKAGDTNYKIDVWKWKEHDVTATVAEDPVIAAKVAEVNEPFEGETFDPTKFEANPFNGTKPALPLDTVIGTTEIEISRNRFSFEHPSTTGHQPGVIEGTGHSLITDAFRHFALNTPVADDATQRTYAQIDAPVPPATAPSKYTVGAIRGFRYVNSYPAGSELTYEDLYHFLSIGPQMAVGDFTAAQMNNSSENAADSCMNPNVTAWAGGWMFNYSGVTLDMNPYLGNVQVGGTNPVSNTISQGRLFNFKLGRTSVHDPAAGSLLADGANGRVFRYASYFYDSDPQNVNNIAINTNNTKPDSIRVLMRNTDLNRYELVKVNCATATTPVAYPRCAIDPKYAKVDAVELVAKYVQDVLGGVITAANLPYPRINLSNGTTAEFLPDTRQSLGFPTVEPVWGARKDDPNEANDSYDQTYGQVNYTGGQIDQD